jgi:hypothetical protein
LSAATAHDSSIPVNLSASDPRTDSKAPLYMKLVMKGGKVSSVQVTTADHADIVATFVKQEDTGVIVHIENRLMMPVKLDAYISGDGSTYFYTSTCPLAAHFSSFERWADQVRWIAFREARSIAPGEEGLCI